MDGTSLDCPLPSPALTISGANFGPSGAQVLLHTGGGQALCGTVEHVVGHEDSQLICHDPGLPPRPLPPSGLYVAVEVVTQYGTTHNFSRAVMFAGSPRVTALLPLSPPCAPAGPHALAGCVGTGTGSDFAILGEGLLGWGATRVTVGPNPCRDVVGYNASYVECHGATGYGERQPVAIYVGVHRHMAADAAALSISFADPCLTKPGFWAAPACTDCKPGYYGPSCSLGCLANGSGAVCSGRGACDDGVAGSGACACDADAARGFWTGVACARCRDGYIGADCRGVCPSADIYGAGVSVTCGGHGSCVEPGACTCDLPWAGRACDVRCPADAALAPCSGHGQCRAGAVPPLGVCLCASNATLGHWAGTACQTCAEGWVGPNCAQPCPGQGLAGGVCAGHGRCVATAAAAVCECDALHVGPACAQPCPTDAAGQVCGAHGACVAGATAARCACAADAASGFWAGSACGACAYGYTGDGCAVQCPADSAGTVCSDRGNCTDWGACVCAPGTCGTACEKQGADCVLTCPPGFYGLQCEGACACGAHGTCQDGPYGSGLCACDAGWVGAQCAFVCEGAASGLPCSGHGHCDPLNGACVCRAGYRTLPSAPACAAACPGAPGRLCSGRGSCNATAQCECDAGYGGADCSVPCPRDAAGRVCGAMASAPPPDSASATAGLGPGIGRASTVTRAPRATTGPAAAACACPQGPPTGGSASAVKATQGGLWSGMPGRGRHPVLGPRHLQRPHRPLRVPPRLRPQRLRPAVPPRGRRQRNVLRTRAVQRDLRGV